MSEWINPPTQEEVNTHAGFVYLISDTETDMKYIGKKTFWSKETKPPLKTLKTKPENERLDRYDRNLAEAKLKRLIKNRVSDKEKKIKQRIISYKEKIKKRQANKKGVKRRSIVESQWRDYYGSNDIIKGLVAEGYENRFKRRILMLCKDKWDLSYYEAKLQFNYDVLLKEEFYNGYVSVKLYTKNTKGERK